MLFDKVVAVTGATSGIGKSCVKTLIEKGCRVVALGRRQDRLIELFENYGREKLFFVVCDVTSEESIRQAIKQIPAEFKPISKLINNAGLIQGAGPLEEYVGADIDRMLDTNIKGLVNITRTLIPDLVASKFGHIVNISSIGAFYHYKFGHVYAASKAFVEHFGRCLSVEMAEQGVRVTNIAPGKTQTEFSLVHHKGDEDKARRVYESITPLTPEDVARAILWSLEQPTHVQISSIELAPANQLISFR